MAKLRLRPLCLIVAMLLPAASTLAQSRNDSPVDLRADAVWSRPLTYADHLMLLVKEKLNDTLAPFNDGRPNGLFVSQRQHIGPAHIRIDPDSGHLVVRLEFMVARLSKSRAEVCTFMLHVVDSAFEATMPQQARDNYLSYLYPPSAGQLPSSERSAANSRLIASSRAVISVMDESVREEFSCMRAIGASDIRVTSQKY